MDFVEDRALFLLTRDGFYPKIGSLTTGSGFAFGLGYRDRDMFARRGVAEVWAAGTAKKYWAIQGRVAFPEEPRARYMVDVVGNLRDYPKEAFYGLGPDSERQDALEFGLRTSEVAGRAGVRPVDPLFFGGGLGLYTSKAYSRAVGTELDYVRSRGYVEVDYREPLNARRGGWYRLDVSHYADSMTASEASRAPISTCASLSAFSPSAACSRFAAGRRPRRPPTTASACRSI